MKRDTIDWLVKMLICFMLGAAFVAFIYWTERQEFELVDHCHPDWK